MDSTKEYMDLMSSKRKFFRTDKFTVHARVSRDEKRWSRIEVSDISTGGLLFKSKKTFEIGESVWFDLEIQPIMFVSHTTMKLKTQGEVLGGRAGEEYAAKFVKLPSSEQTELGIIIELILEKYGSILD